MKNNKLRFTVIVGVIIIGLLAGIFLLIRDPRVVKGVGKIEARYELSMQGLSSGRSTASPKIYATIDGQTYRLIPMSSTGGQITMSNNDFLIEGFAPQFGLNMNYYDENNDISKEILSEANKIFKKICDGKPEYANIETANGLARRILSYLKDGDTKLLITIDMKPIK